MSENRSGINWRYTAMKPRIGPFDAYLVFPPLFVFALHIKWWTFFVMVTTILVMWLVEIFLSMPMNVALRTIRSGIAGSIRPAIPWWKKTKL